MENEITWYNNLKQLVFNNYTYEDYNHIFKTLNEVYRNVSSNSNRLWFDFKYLILYLIYILPIILNLKTLIRSFLL